MTDLEYFNSINKVINLLDKNKQKVVKYLSQYETKITAEDEIDRSLATLRGFKKEFAECSFSQNNIAAVFFPLNLPLYSLILFAVAPVFFCKEVYIRCNVRMLEILEDLCEILDISENLPQLILTNCTRSFFVYKVVKKKANIVLFTGKYENAKNIIEICENKLLILNGSGINPVVVCDDADVDLAIEKTYKMRLYNGGQDCAGPDVIFVHENISAQFIRGIIERIDKTICGPYMSNDCLEVGPLIKEGYVEIIKKFLQRNNEYIVAEGKIVDSIVSPYVVSKKIDEHMGGFDEFFAPIFYILVYSNELQVKAILDANLDNSMYLTCFGNRASFGDFSDKATIIRNCIIDDIERGNMPYGGYGIKANFVCANRKIESRPILLSREINDYLMKV